MALARLQFDIADAAPGGVIVDTAYHGYPCRMVDRRKQSTRERRAAGRLPTVLRLRGTVSPDPGTCRAVFVADRQYAACCSSTPLFLLKRRGDGEAGDRLRGNAGMGRRDLSRRTFQIGLPARMTTPRSSVTKGSKQWRNRSVDEHSGTDSCRPSITASLDINKSGATLLPISPMTTPDDRNIGDLRFRSWVTAMLSWSCPAPRQ